MEDKQPAAGDLTDEAVAEEAATEEATEEAATEEAAAEDEAAEEAAADEADLEDETDKAEPDAAAVAGDKPAKSKKRGRLVAAVVALLVVLFVGSAAFAGATVQPYLAERASVEVKLKVARAAASAITTLWSYTPENMDTLADRAANYLTGDFGAQYRKYVDAMVAPTKQAQITNSTEVSGVGIESLNGPNAVAIVYTNTTTTTPVTKNIPALKYLSYRLIMKREHDRWMVTRMTTITSLDMTPHL